jgi:hypothetical protein
MMRTTVKAISKLYLRLEKQSKRLSLLLAGAFASPVLQSAAFAGYGYSPIPYLSGFKKTGALTCQVQGYSTTIEVVRTTPSDIHICLIEKSLLFTEDGARFELIEVVESSTPSARIFGSYPKQLNCRELSKRDGEGWRLFASRPHKNWFNAETRRTFGALPMQMSNGWWWLPNYRRSYYDSELMDPPISNIYKQICRQWKQRGSHLD